MRRIALSGLWIIGLAVAAISCDSKSTRSADQTLKDSLDQAPPKSARPAHWGYAGEIGPDSWSTLSPVYALCAEGKGQSPINLAKADVKGSANWQFNYKTTSLRISHNEHMNEITDNGHTIQVTVDEGSTFTFGDKTYSLKQFHFHTPSEHTIDGQQMPMEVHMVHQSSDGRLAVVSVMFKESKADNENLEKVIAHLPNAKGESRHIKDANLELKFQLPKDNYAYHYIGSLTTPPCSEGVQWLVLREMKTLSANQAAAISSRIGPNNRPVQQLNDRSVEASDLVGKVDN